MSTIVNVAVPFDRLVNAIRDLPPDEKPALWRLFDQDIDRATIAERFAAALKDIRSTYSNVSEDEVMAEALQTTHEARKLRRNVKNRS